MGFFSKLFGKQSNIKKLTKRELTEQLIDLLKQHIPDIETTLLNTDDPEQISVSIRTGDANEFMFYPDNLYYSYLQGNNNFDEYQANIIQNIKDAFNPSNETITLLPSIKSMTWLKDCQIAIKQLDPNAKEDPLVYLPLVGDLIIVFALDTPHNMSYLYQSQLITYAPDEDLQALYQQAIQNFKEYLETTEITIDPIELGYSICVDSNYDASLVFIIDQLLPNISLQGEPIIAIIARNQLIIADSNNSEQVNLLANYAKQQMLEAPYVLSSELYCLKNSKLNLYNLH